MLRFPLTIFFRSPHISLLLNRAQSLTPQPHATFLQASFHSGGKKAAEWLHYDIAQYLYDKKIHFSRILVRIYGDPFVIARNAGIAPEDLQDLFIGFSEAKELFDFIPVFRKGRAEREERMEMTGVQRKIGGKFKN